ncbi:MAG: nucleoside deaminase [Holosporaceae bacterium]|jgi:tRNA(adenine34) deaminase|nr:nucleoside deaminase [Holosporaceae bacterium]
MKFMNLALEEAQKAGDRGSVPVGAVVVRAGAILASAGNEMRKLLDPTAHAEIIAIRRASQLLETCHLDECDIYVTLEPCAMCAQAMSWARIRRLYFGAYDPKCGGITHGCRVFNHSLHVPEVMGGVFETQCAKILQKFFLKRR